MRISWLIPFVSAAAAVSAQIPAGDAAVMWVDLSNFNKALASVTLAPGSTPSAIGPISSALAAAANQVVVEATTGNLIVGSASTVGGSQAELHRLVLSGTTVVSETLLATLPNTGGPVEDIHQEDSGCLLVVSDDGSGFPVVHRVSATPVAALVTQVPLQNHFGTPGGTFSGGVASDAAGNVARRRGAARAGRRARGARAGRGRALDRPRRRRRRQPRGQRARGFPR